MENTDDERCYSHLDQFIMALAFFPNLILFVIDFIRLGAWRTGISVVWVDARIMPPAYWLRHLAERGVSAWEFYAPIDGGCEWAFAVRKTQERWAREIIRRTSAGNAPTPWADGSDAKGDFLNWFYQIFMH